MENLIYGEDVLGDPPHHILAGTEAGSDTPQSHIQLTGSDTHQTLRLNTSDLHLTTEPRTVEEAVQQLQMGDDTHDFSTPQHLHMDEDVLATPHTVQHLHIGDSTLHTPQTLQLSADALHTIDTVKLEGVTTSQGETVTVDGHQYISFNLGDQNVHALQAALNAGTGLQSMELQPAGRAEEGTPGAEDSQAGGETVVLPVYEGEEEDIPRVQHVTHTYDRIKLRDSILEARAKFTPPQQPLPSAATIKVEDRTGTKSSEEEEDENLRFEAELRKLSSVPERFVIGPPSGSEDEDEDNGNSASLMKAVIRANSGGDPGANQNGDEFEDGEDEKNDPTYDFNDLLVKGEDYESEESSDAFPDEGIVRDQVVYNRSDDNKQVVVKRKRNSVHTSQSKRQKTKMHSEDPELLKQLHAQYNSMCVFCHKSHEQGCLIWDPMEKYEDLEQVGPPYTYGMPDQFLMGLSRVYEGAYSLFARDDIPAFTQFGPLKGRIVEEAEFRKISLLEIDIENFWPIEASENDELLIENWLDTSDVEISNWLKFLLPESSENEAPHYNLQRVTRQGEIYFVTTQHILSGEELFMRAMEPPYRVYHNLRQVNRTSFGCGLFHNIKTPSGAQTIMFDNMVHYVRHHLFVHSIHPGVCSAAYIYNCAICGEDCYTKSQRLAHMTETHKDEENIKSILKRDRRCYYCKKTFSTQAMLGHHIKYNHPRDEYILSGFQCPLCKAKVKTKSTLRKHLNESHQPVNVTCTICGKVLKNRGTLKIHVLKIHEKKGLKQCSICDKSFSDIYQLRVHSLTHTRLRPFECQVYECSSACTTKQCLQKHYRLKHGFNDENMPEIIRSIDAKDIPIPMVM